MLVKEDIAKVLEDKKAKLSNSTNDLLSLYRKLLEEKIDYKKDSKYNKSIFAQRKMINNLEAEVVDLEKQLKDSQQKNIVNRIKEYKKVKGEKPGEKK